MKSTVFSTMDAITAYYQSKDGIIKRIYKDTGVFDADRAQFFKKNRNGHVYVDWFEQKRVIHHRLRKNSHSGVERRVELGDWPTHIKMLRLLEG